MSSCIQVPIVKNLTASGLQEDCPFRTASGADKSRPEYLTAETVEVIDTEAFAEYAGRLNQYLQVCEVPSLCDLSSNCKSTGECMKNPVNPYTASQLPESHRLQCGARAACLSSYTTCGLFDPSGVCI